MKSSRKNMALPKMTRMFQAALVAGALLPWNATAIDRADFNILPGNKFSSNYVESLLVKSLFAITQGHLEEASQTIDQVLKTAPNFKLAHLIRGDLLMARAQQLQSFGDAGQNSETIEGFREEARTRLERYLSEQTPNNLPEPLWKLDPSQQYAIVVDTSRSRLYLYRNSGGTPHYVADYYVTIGKNGSEKRSEGDKRTPLGVYFSSPKLTKKLPDFYGDSAYPLNYPNVWDRHEGRDGHGIWLHGTPSTTYSRAPRASDGCVVLSNPDLKSLAPILKDGNVPVVITKDLQWLPANTASPDSEKLRAALESWRTDWQAQDTDKYLAHYSRDFFNRSADYTRWAQEKRRIQTDQSPVEITLSNVSMFRYPHSKLEMAIVTFDQDYKSHNLDSRMRKRQYWVLENQQWKIMYEGPA
ncbi:MAG TPA: L,D-transpeptidase family protein [Methylophilaceae bacterium]|nr:L,D-transpeptidase family protein [Methylophilaceae bacterium]